MVDTSLAGHMFEERVVFMISGPFGSDVDAWADEIDEALSVIREKIPRADVIALQSVVGPPKGHDECLIDGNPVRASTQWKYIAEAIEQVAPKHEDVVVGALPRLHSCGTTPTPLDTSTVRVERPSRHPWRSSTTGSTGRTSKPLTSGSP